MKFTIDIDINNAKAKALLDYINTLDFIKVEEQNSSIRSVEIDEFLEEALNSIEEKGTLSHDEVMEETKARFPQLFK